MALPQRKGTLLALAHFLKGRPVYDDDLSRPCGLPGPLPLNLPSGLTTALHRELDGHPEM